MDIITIKLTTGHTVRVNEEMDRCVYAPSGEYLGRSDLHSDCLITYDSEHKVAITAEEHSSLSLSSILAAMAPPAPRTPTVTEREDAYGNVYSVMA